MDQMMLPLQPSDCIGDKGAIMLKINGLMQGLPVFRTLGSDVRMQIVQLLAETARMNLGEIAERLGLTSGAVTPHIRKLEEEGIICVTSEHSARGTQKVCSLAVDQLLFDVSASVEERQMIAYETQIRIGHYSDYSVKAPCGLAGADRMIGSADDPRSFAYPERVDAELLWLSDGYVEYRIPNLLPEKQEIVQLTISFEISSALFGSPEDTLSELKFYLNDAYIGKWLSLRCPDSARGIYTPLWYDQKERLYGYLKMLVINQMGVYLDGARIDHELDPNLLKDSKGDLKLRFETHPESGHGGGLALYGSGFGNYHQNIHVRAHYMPEDILNG